MIRTHNITLSIICATTLLLGGCASMSRTQCQQIGWKQEGINDANRGLPPQSLSQYNVCVENYGIPINHKLYHQGWVMGRSQYCIPGNATARAAPTTPTLVSVSIVISSKAQRLKKISRTVWLTTGSEQVKPMVKPGDFNATPRSTQRSIPA